MAEEAKDQAADPSAASEPAQGSGDSESQANQGTTESKDVDAGQAKADQEQGDGKPADKAVDAKTDASVTPSADSKPKSRRSAEYRIDQLTRENRKLKEQVGSGKTATDTASEAVEDTQDQPKAKESDISALVEAEVARRLKPFESVTTKTADDAEIKELFSGKPEAQKKYEPKIRQLWNLPQYKNLSAEDLYKVVSHDDSIDAAKAAAIEEYKKAEQDAKEQSTGGSSNNSNRSGKGSSAAMTDAEILENNERVKAGLK